LMVCLLGEADFVLRPPFEIILIFVGHFTRKSSTRYAASITNRPGPPFLEKSLTWIGLERCAKRWVPAFRKKQRDNKDF
jgi:hypothetical protein